MKKLIISLLVVAMALGTMGVAFTNGFNIPRNGGYMAEGFTYLEDIRCIHVALIPCFNDALEPGQPPQEAVMSCGVCVKFDKKVVPGTMIFVGVMGVGGGYPNDYIAYGYGQAPYPGGYPCGQAICVPFETGPIFAGPDIINANRIVVRVIGGEMAQQHGPFPH